MSIERVSVAAPTREPDALRTAAVPAAPTSGLLRLYPALASPNFRLLWLGMMPATLAVMMNQVASPFAAFTLSNSAAILGIVSLAQGLPMLLLSLVGGVAADRLPRRLVLIGSQLTLGLAAAALAALGISGNLQVWHVVAASFVQGAAFAFNMPARQAYIAELVTRPVRRPSVLAISSVLLSAEKDENRNPTTTNSASATGNERVIENPIKANPRAIARPT